VLVLILAAEALRGAGIPRRGLMLAVGAAAAVLALNTGWLLKDGSGRRADTEILASELSAADLARGRLPRSHPIDTQRTGFLTARAYFEAVDDLGSPAPPASELPEASPEARAAADKLLASGVARIRTRDRGARRPALRVRLSGSAARFARRRARCVAVRPPPGRTVDAVLTLPARGLVVLPSRPGRAHVLLRRFGDRFVTPRPAFSTVATGSLVTVPLDRSPVPWRIRVVGSRFKLC
jgi:hypothetical protein